MTANNIENRSDVSRHYRGYEKFKGWNKPFAFTAQDQEYFSGEMRGIALAGRNVMDIGFGPGIFLAWAKSAGANVAGTEINPTLLEVARDFGVELLNPNIETVSDQYAGRFDVITAFDVFEHFSLDEIDARLHAAETMLRPGGHLVLRFPNGQSPFGLSPQYGDVTHKIALSKDMIEQLSRDTSLRTQRYQGSYRVRGAFGPRRLGREMRYIARNILAVVLNNVYACNIPWDPVVVLVLRKQN